MSKDGKTMLPGYVGYQDAAKIETEKVSAKIDVAFQKLSRKMRERADKAKSKMTETRRPEKRAILLRRFELYADAATHLEERLPQRDRN